MYFLEILNELYPEFDLEIKILHTKSEEILKIVIASINTSLKNENIKK